MPQCNKVVFYTKYPQVKTGYSRGFAVTILQVYFLPQCTKVMSHQKTGTSVIVEHFTAVVYAIL
jgi:hypothetical protein